MPFSVYRYFLKPNFLHSRFTNCGGFVYFGQDIHYIQYIFCHDMVLKKYASIMQFCQPFDMWSVSERTHKLHDSVISSWSLFSSVVALYVLPHDILNATKRMYLPVNLTYSSSDAATNQLRFTPMMRCSLHWALHAFGVQSGTPIFRPLRSPLTNVMATSWLPAGRPASNVLVCSCHQTVAVKATLGVKYSACQEFVTGKGTLIWRLKAA